MSGVPSIVQLTRRPRRPSDHVFNIWQMKAEEMRLRVMNEVDVLGNIMAIASGDPIKGVPNPTPEQVLYCNFVLLKKILGDAPQVQPAAVDPDAVEQMADQTRAAAQAVLDKLNSAAVLKATTVDAIATVVEQTKV